MKRLILVLTLLVVILFQSGCTSYAVRRGQPMWVNQGGLYAGTRADIILVTVTFLNPLPGIFFLGDLPLTFAVDTVLLPYDSLVMVARGENPLDIFGREVVLPPELRPYP